MFFPFSVKIVLSNYVKKHMEGMNKMSRKKVVVALGHRALGTTLP